MHFAFLRRRAINTCSSVAIIDLSLGRCCAAHVDQLNKGLLIFIHINLYSYKLLLNVHRWSQESALRAVKEQVKQVGELLKSWVNGCLISINFFFVYPYHGCAAKNNIFFWSKLFTDIFIEFIQLIRVIIKQLLKHVAWAWRLSLRWTNTMWM